MRFVRGRRTHRFALVTALLTAALFLVLAATAAAEVRSGSTTDPVESGPGSEERVEPGQDIVAVSASYDTATGTVTATVRTAGAPEPSAERLLRTDFSTVDEYGDCVEPEIRMASYYGGSTTRWFLTTGSEGDGTKSVDGNVTTLTATSPVLANGPFACMNAYIVEPDDEGNYTRPFEYLVPPLKLTGPQPPQPPPPPAPAALPAAPPPPPPRVPKVAKLAVPSKALTVRRNQWRKVKLKVRNTGNAAAGKVTLKVGKARGVAVKPRSGKLKLRKIAPGKSRVASFKVRLTKKAKARSKLKLRVRGARGVKANGTLTLKVRKQQRPKKHGKKGKQPPAAATPLAEKIFYAYKTETSHSATLIGYAFIDGEWAWHGIPSEGLPSCTAVTGNAENEGCVKYRYDARSGTVRIGSLSGKITADGALEIDGETYFATAVPQAGARLQVEQEFIGFSGLCGLIAGCSTWHEHLILTNAGEFVLSHSSLTTAGGTGPGQIFIAAGSYPPDQYGTYAIEKGARLKLAFADGTVKTKTIAIFLNKEGKPDPVYEGLLVGENYFTFAHSD